MNEPPYPLTTTITPAHHLVVSDEGGVHFTEDGQEFLVYDSDLQMIVRIPSCETSWKFFGLEVEVADEKVKQIKNEDTDTENVIFSEDQTTTLDDKDSLTFMENTDNFITDVDLKVQQQSRNTITTYSKSEPQRTITTNKNQIKPPSCLNIKKNEKVVKKQKKTDKNTKGITNEHIYKINNDSNPDNVEFDIPIITHDSYPQIYSMIKEEEKSPNPPAKRRPCVFRKPRKSGLLDHFKLELLTPEQQKEKFEQRKFHKTKYLNRMFKCTSCFRGFQLQDKFAKHYLTHLVKTKYCCEYCNIYFKTNIKYYTHMKTHREELICKYCPYTTSHRSLASLHMKSHKAKVDRSLLGGASSTCPMCGISFLNQRGLGRHIYLVHEDDVSVPINGPHCRQCDITFANTKALEVHNQYLHKNGELYTEIEGCTPPSPIPAEVFSKREIRTRPPEHPLDLLTTLKTGYITQVKEEEPEDVPVPNFSYGDESDQCASYMEVESYQEDDEGMVSYNQGKQSARDDENHYRHVMEEMKQEVSQDSFEEDCESEETVFKNEQECERSRGFGKTRRRSEYDTDNVIVKYEHDVEGQEDQVEEAEESFESPTVPKKKRGRPVKLDILRDEPMVTKVRDVPKVRKGQAVVMLPKECPRVIMAEATDEATEEATEDHQMDPTTSILLHGNELGEEAGNVLCSLCGAIFSDEEKLSEHMHLHEPIAERECAICHEKFTDNLLLIKHVHKHSSLSRVKKQAQRPVCQLCGMSFSALSNCLRHIKFTHSEVRAYKCKNCGRAFKTSGEARSHNDHVHLKLPWPARNRGGPRRRQPKDKPPKDWPRPQDKELMHAVVVHY